MKIRLRNKIRGNFRLDPREPGARCQIVEHVCREVRPLSLVVSALALSALGACAPSRPATTATSASTTTAASLDSPAAPAAAPSTAAEAPPQEEPTPPGELVCSTKAGGHLLQLFLQWDGTTAKGTLRDEAPSGMVRHQHVKAERYKERIIVDEPESTDLVAHMATVLDTGGKRRIQLGDWNQPWSTCEK
jgi:hypothetical protein